VGALEVERNHALCCCHPERRRTWARSKWKETTRFVAVILSEAKDPMAI
jgi:hypothetical protein